MHDLTGSTLKSRYLRPGHGKLRFSLKDRQLIAKTDLKSLLGHIDGLFLNGNILLCND